MNRRTFLKIGLLAGIGMVMPRAAFSNTPPPPDISKMKLLDRRPTVADRAAAAANARRMGNVPGALNANAVNFTGVPHYFGPYPNYANSPLPHGGIGTITVDDPGSGYVDTNPPAVTFSDVYGLGGGATATAKVVNGKVTAIKVTAPGAGYTAPLVTIDPPVSGVPALASAVIGGTLNGGIRKFVDSFAGLTAAGASTLGSYMSIASPETLSITNAAYPAPLDQSDYVEIAIVEFTQQFHSDLPSTRLRGYVQLETENNKAAAGTAYPLTYPDNTPILKPDGITQYTAMDQPRYLGPLIIASHDRATRVRLVNLLPTGPEGDLFIPVDETIMGAGDGPNDKPGQPGVKEKYTQNRATFHLHGGLTPWISDGTPHQWVTAQGEISQYQQGVSTVNVPDMWYNNLGELVAIGPETAKTATGVKDTANSTNDPGQGSMTFYYTNQQSARLMFYHDHAFGITRLNVYVGEAAGYLLTDEVEQDLINGTNISGVNPGLLKVLPDVGIPLVFQDKTFVDERTIAYQDPTWHWNLDGNGNAQKGSLWVPSVYMPAQNPWDPTGANAFGRWQYGPWFWPPTTNIQFGQVANDYFGTSPWEPPMVPAMPSPSMGMEAFNDTTMVNGVVYPYLEVDAKVVRFRVLNAANDRFANLQLYLADPDVVTSDGRTNTEVRMVGALATPGFPATWPTDGRAGGVPDPAMAGPDWVMIGSEGGFLPEPVVLPPQPVAWNMNATAFNVGNVTSHSLLLGSAERADVLVDFTPYAGRTLILYNDAPTAFPALDPRYDYYTGTPDQTSSGGAPTTQPGYGPNTRTVMQIRVKGPDGGAGLSAIVVTNGGQDYVSAPTVVIDPSVSDITGGGAAATATCGIDHISILASGAGYEVAPTVVITGGGGTGAAADAIITRGRVTSIQVTNPGSGYSTAPSIKLEGGVYNGLDANGAPSYIDPLDVASASSALFVSAITLDQAGSAYTALPMVMLVGGGGYSAMAVALFAPSGSPALDLPQLQTVWKKTDSKRGVFECFQDPLIIPQAAYNSAYNTNSLPADNSQYIQLQDFTRIVYADPIINPNAPVVRLSIQNGGMDYTDNPTVTISAPDNPSGVQATAIATAVNGVLQTVALTNVGSGYTSEPIVTVSDTTGTGAVVLANRDIYGNPIINASAPLVRITVTNGGINYPNNPTVTIAAPNSVGGVQATAIATAVNGVLKSVTLTNPGSGYTAAPLVTIAGGTGATVVVNELQLQPKAIHDEMGAAYDIEYGRMSSMLGLELPKSNSLLQNMSLYGYASPPVDIVQDTTIVPLGSLSEGTQIWKITQNGVDTHPMHFHLANVQIVNRVAWDNALLPPEPLELGWKETVRTNPLEHLIVAMRPVVPILPFDIPNSIRAIDVTKPLGAPLMGGPNGFIDPLGNRTIVMNHTLNFGWEFVWHCHILSHEEMDMMHALPFAVSPKAPTNLNVTFVGNGNGRRAILRWTNPAANATGFVAERAANPDFTGTLVTLPVAGLSTTVTDLNPPRNGAFYYRVKAINVVGDTAVYRAPAVGYPNTTVVSKPSNVFAFVPPQPPVAPSNVLVDQPGPSGSVVVVTWTDNATNETNFTIQRARIGGGGGLDWTTLRTTVAAGAGAGTTVTFLDNSTSRGRTYVYRVQATNAVGASAWAQSTNFTTK
jgi:FtsP/CotA-like multicopper oxidase with cupredoxin domain